MIRTEIERLAAAGHALRPDWPAASLRTWLETQHASDAYRDVAVALTVVATDPATRTPARLTEPGPWWDAAQAASGEPAGRVPIPAPFLADPKQPDEVARTGAAACRDALRGRS